MLDDSKVTPFPGPQGQRERVSENNQWTLCKAHLFASTIAHPPPGHLPSPEAFLAALRQKITANNINSMYSASVSHKAVARTANIPEESASTDRSDAVNIITVTQTVNDYMNGSRACGMNPCETPTFKTNAEAMGRNRPAISRLLRSRKMDKRRAWDDLADAYLTVQHKVG